MCRRELSSLPGQAVGSDKRAVVVEDSLVAGDHSSAVVDHKQGSRLVVVRKVGDYRSLVEVAEAAELVVAAGPLEEAVEAELVAPRHPGRVVELDFVPFDHPRASSRP
jgi:hypothetical protein